LIPNPQPMTIKIIATGGTIDKIYFDAKSAFQVGDPTAPLVLEEANITVDYEVQSLLRKDSLEMDDGDRALIRHAVEASAQAQIIITHGTDTMLATARALGHIPGKTIVLTGSMQPARLRLTDAVFNIGFALAAVQLLPPGVYIGMNGRVFNPWRSKKNVALNRFEDE